MPKITEHSLTLGLTNWEVSVLLGSLEDRAAIEPAESPTCDAIRQIVLDQLGAEDGVGGWRKLRAA